MLGGRASIEGIGVQRGRVAKKTNKAITLRKRALRFQLLAREFEAAEYQGNSKAPVGRSLEPIQVLNLYSHCLTLFEKVEIAAYRHIYFIGKSPYKIFGDLHSDEFNHGYDDEHGNYRIVQHDHIGYRYEVISTVGEGSFGQVVKVFDHRTCTIQALKIVSKHVDSQEALLELEILKRLQGKDTSSGGNVVHLEDHFMFRGHLCIAFELMSASLQIVLEHRNYQGLDLGIIRVMAAQLLGSLHFLRSQGVMHCDLKPDNILLKDPDSLSIKLIDFGSSCLQNDQRYVSMGTLCYSAPEVLAEDFPYSTAVDMWSLACILAELYTGYPLFAGQDEAQQLVRFAQLLGPPPTAMTERCPKVNEYRDVLLSPDPAEYPHPDTHEVAQILARCPDQEFLSFLRGCLQWQPSHRMTPLEAMDHPFVSRLKVVMPFLFANMQ